eukprot:TRINITY_DN5556_c0_g1_i2.p2 TRINITY_DN5556_c0_g1~~TRINITY_DN5556_c0_g1_i2.p2  ORF type:complete len:976 (-),score=267.05 TRINITY_DN5556_c0_g1_i2:63-2990(-)
MTQCAKCGGSVIPGKFCTACGTKNEIASSSAPAKKSGTPTTSIGKVASGSSGSNSSFLKTPAKASSTAASSSSKKELKFCSVCGEPYSTDSCGQCATTKSSTAHAASLISSTSKTDHSSESSSHSGSFVQATKSASASSTSSSTSSGGSFLKPAPPPSKGTTTAKPPAPSNSSASSNKSFLGNQTSSQTSSSSSNVPPRSVSADQPSSKSTPISPPQRTVFGNTSTANAATASASNATLSPTNSSSASSSASSSTAGNNSNSSNSSWKSGGVAPSSGGQNKSFLDTPAPHPPPTPNPNKQQDGHQPHPPQPVAGTFAPHPPSVPKPPQPQQQQATPVAAESGLHRPRPPPGPSPNRSSSHENATAATPAPPPPVGPVFAPHPPSTPNPNNSTQLKKPLPPPPPALPKPSDSKAGALPPPPPPPAKGNSARVAPPRATVSAGSNSDGDSQSSSSSGGAIGSRTTPKIPKRTVSGSSDDGKLTPSSSSENSPSSESARRSWKQKYDTLKKKTKKGKGSFNFAVDEPADGSPNIRGNKGSTIRTRSYTDSSLDPRSKAILELVETEDDYIKDLEVIIGVFMEPMKREGIATPQEISTLFSNVELIIGVNRQLLSDLKSLEGGKGLGEAFLKTVDFLKMYANYCMNQENAFKTLTKLKKDKKFESFLVYCAARPDCLGLDLGAFLIKPVQRICKYPLLLRELIRRTDEFHPEYQALNDAYNKIEEVVGSINEKKRESELRQKIYELSQMLVNAESLKLITPTRRYLKEGEVHYYDLEGSLKQAYYFLFNDLFLVTKKKTKHHDLKANVTLDKAVLRLPTVQTEKPSFELIHPELPNKWNFAFNSDEERLKMMEDLQEQIDKQSIWSNTFQDSKVPDWRSYNQGRPASIQGQINDTITFECEYYDKRTVQVPTSDLTIETVRAHILWNFQVEAATIVYNSAYVETQYDLDAILAEGSSTYQLLLYDPPSASAESEAADLN